MSSPLPDPREVRATSLEELQRLGLPLPPDGFPLVWEVGDEVQLRPTVELESRVAVLHLILARCFGLPPETAMTWLLNSRLVDAVTGPEWLFLTAGQGDHRSFVLHHDALFALSWVLGLTKHLDPTRVVDTELVTLMPWVGHGETFAQWRSRTLTAPREPGEAAALLDLYYCLDWAFLEAQQRQLPPPGDLDTNAIGQRRWALEWAVVFRGPYHEPPVGWEEVDLST